MKRALITGISGMDGSHLADLLISKGYEVHGTKRRSSSLNTSRIDHLMSNPNFHLHYADMGDQQSLERAVMASQPDEVYNLAAQSHVGLSFAMPVDTANVTGIGACRLYEAVLNHFPSTKVYQASSSEMFGNSPAPQGIETPFAPVSPYGCAKLYAHRMAATYREAYGMFISCGILFNHESPRRGETFVTRKITRGLARIKAGLQEKLVLGNMHAVRDWGYAPEYVEAMWMMLQKDRPMDMVIGTGISATVGQFLDVALEVAGLDRSCVVTEAPEYTRKAEVHNLRALWWPEALETIGWAPMTRWDKVARIMMEADLKEVGL